MVSVLNQKIVVASGIQNMVVRAEAIRCSQSFFLTNSKLSVIIPFAQDSGVWYLGFFPGNVGIEDSLEYSKRIYALHSIERRPFRK